MPSRQTAARFIAALIIAAAASTAQANPASQVQVFTAEYFASSHPADAYDMVRRLPGFELIEGNADVRGFAGSRGNVLFDGRAPSGKQETLEQILRRIPAASVLRIELIRGGAGNAATAGYEIIANVVRRSTSAVTGSVLGGAAESSQFGPSPEIRAELSRQSGERSLDATVAFTPEIDDDSGKGSIIERDASGDETGFEKRDEREIQRTLSADAEARLPLGAGSIVTNFNLSRENTHDVTRAESDGEIEFTREHQRLWSFEGGAQYHAPDMLGGKLDALAVHRSGNLRSEEADAEQSFSERTHTSETIGRIEYRRGHSPELFGSLEGAINRLSSNNVLEVGGEPVDIAGSDVNVSERRAESALGAIFKPLANLVVETSLRTEVSTIRSSGDSPLSEHFLFWKPRFRAGWNRDDTHIQATVEREAAQLDFSDFVASAEIDRDEVTAGAIALRPPTTWSASALIEQNFWGDGALSLTIRHEWIHDVIDRVVISRGGKLFDAIGNIGKGQRTIVIAELTLPIDRIGVPGMQLRATLTFLKSRVTDPITGERRIISEDRPFEADFRLIHDIPGGRWSWGVEASLAHHERKFRFDQVRLEQKGTSVGGYIEFRPGSDWRVRLEAVNLTSRRLVDLRTKFNESRAAGDIQSVERRRIRTAPIFSFSVRKAFGSAAH
jgi:hypothetical protein